MFEAVAVLFFIAWKNKGKPSHTLKCQYLTGGESRHFYRELHLSPYTSSNDVYLSAI